jgi:hypothetical protein
MKVPVNAEEAEQDLIVLFVLCVMSSSLAKYQRIFEKVLIKHGLCFKDEPLTFACRSSFRCDNH